MPKPPILPVPDRAAIFNAGEDYATWLANADTPPNAERMREIYAATSIPADAAAEIAAITVPVHIIAIAESWCGDVVRHTPVLMRLAECNPLVQVRFITRAADPDFFARFLTNGGEAIPKFVFCAANFNEVGNWGPMSSTPRKYIAKGKACGNGGLARKYVGKFYETDGNRESIREFVDLIQTAAYSGFPPLD